MTDTAGKATVTFTDTVAETANITAGLNGSSQSKPSVFVADASTAVVSTLIIDKDSSLANGTATNSAIATVVDAKGNPVAGQTVTWSADKGTVVFAASGVTDTSGKVTVTFTDTAVETTSITASLNGSSQTKPSFFVADITTAKVMSLDATTGIVANGTTSSMATAIITDASNHPLSGVTVSWSTSGNASLFDQTSTTDASGKAEMTLTDKTAETVNVTATLSTTGSTQTKPVTFVADPTTARIVLAVTSGIVANGRDTSTGTATVADVNHNPLANVVVNWTVEGSAVLAGVTSTTNANGQAVMTLTDKKAEQVLVVSAVSISGRNISYSTPTTFIADNSTATVSTLMIDKDNSPADGKTTNSATATVVDANGNPVSGATVAWSADKGTVKFAAASVTDTHGKVSVTFTDTVAQTANITATLNGSSQTKPSTFKADLASAVITVAVRNSAKPDGTQVEVTATVKDQYGNVVPDFPLDWSATNAYSTISPVNNVTDANGIAKVNVSNASFVDKDVTVTATSGAKSGTAQVHFVGLSVDVFFATSSSALQTTTIAGSVGDLRIEFPENVNYPASAMSVTVQGESAAGTTVDAVSVFTGSSYHAFVRNITKVGTLQATFKIGELVQTSNILTVVPSSINNSQSTFILSPPSIPQGGKTVVTLTPIDQYGNPNAQIGNGASAITLVLPSITGISAPATLTHMPDGTYQAEITTTASTPTGTFVINAQGGTANMSTNLTITPDPTHAVGTIVLYSGICHVGVPCRTIATVTSKTTGDALVGVQVTFREVSATGAVISPTTVTTNGLGTNSSIYVTGNTAGTVNLVAEIAGSVEAQPTNSLTISP